jgi:NADH-quinone oxidoreductase subunit J
VITAASLISAVFLLLTVRIFMQSDVETNQLLTGEGDIGLTEKLGTVLYSDYVIPFELASILFMGSMIGAVMLSRKTKKERKAEAR